MIRNGLFKWKTIIFAFPLLVIPASFTILGNHMTKSKKKQAKLDETEKLWYLVLLNFWSLLPEVQFYVSANSKIFLFPNFLKSWVSAVSRVHRTDSELICYVLQKFSKAFLIMVENFIIPCKNWQLHFLIFIWSLSRYFADDFISRSSAVVWNILTTKSSSSESMASPQFRDAFCFSCFWNSKM